MRSMIMNAPGSDIYHVAKQCDARGAIMRSMIMNAPGSDISPRFSDAMPTGAVASRNDTTGCRRVPILYKNKL